MSSVQIARKLELPVAIHRYEWKQPGDLLHLDVK
jgi:hypothetical protein